MKYFLLALKICFSFAMLYYVLKGLDFSSTFKILDSAAGIWALLLGIFIVLIQTVFAGYRVKLILNIFNYSISAFNSIWFLFLGNFYSQSMISFIGGDAMRVMILAKSGVNTTYAMKSILLDRVLGFIGLQLLFFSALPFLLPIIINYTVMGIVLALSISSLLSILAFVAFGFIQIETVENNFLKKILELCSVSKYLLSFKVVTFNIILISCFVHFMNILAIFYLTNILGGNIQLFQAFIIGTPVMLLSLLPISIGGWGVRENAMMVGFGMLGISPEIGLAVSIIIGISSLIGSFPGCFVLFGKYKVFEKNITMPAYKGYT